MGGRILVSEAKRAVEPGAAVASGRFAQATRAGPLRESSSKRATGFLRAARFTLQGAGKSALVCVWAAGAP